MGGPEMRSGGWRGLPPLGAERFVVTTHSPVVTDEGRPHLGDRWPKLAPSNFAVLVLVRFWPISGPFWGHNCAFPLSRIPDWPNMVN